MTKAEGQRSSRVRTCTHVYMYTCTTALSSAATLTQRHPALYNIACIACIAYPYHTTPYHNYCSSSARGYCTVQGDTRTDEPHGPHRDSNPLSIYTMDGYDVGTKRHMYLHTCMCCEQNTCTLCMGSISQVSVSE
jgi:hypothetical protein